MINEYMEELYRSLYLAEQERQDKLNSQIALVIGVTSILGGVLTFYIEKCPDVEFTIDNQDWLLTFFVLCLTGMFLSICFAGYFIVRSTFNYLYGYLSDAQTLNNHASKMADFFGSQASDNEYIENQLVQEMRELIAEQHLMAATINREKNIQKSNWIHRAHIALIVGLTFSAVSVFPFHVVTTRYPSIDKIEIVNPERQT